ncbi:MAG: hydroxymethylglutaryl-CoA synthase family protein [Acidimicrobiales bacterium]
MKIGVEAMACHIPRHYVGLDDLADLRGVDRRKFSSGLDVQNMAIATPAEDAVYLAATAAEKVLEKFDIDPNDIGAVVVGTETGVDHSKPIAVYLHEALSLRTNCTAFEVKHACFGASAGLSWAVDWIASGRARGSKALVVATDIARYGLETAGEPTQGAGAVAMVVSDEPRLLSLEPALVGEYTRNVMDFWRPLHRSEALTDGHYSIECYLTALRACIDDAGPDLPSVEDFDACLYHVPFPKMALKAHSCHRSAEIGSDTARTDAERASYETRVAPWLSLNREIGNVYTGSVYLALLDLLRQGQVPDGGTVSLFSYGSGCTASLRVGQLVDGYHRYADRLDPADQLAARVRLTIEEYEELMSEPGSQGLADWQTHPEAWGLPASRFTYLGTKSHVRQYVGI